MEKAAIYHRPESEMAYYDGEHIRIRLKVGKKVEKVYLIYGDPYDFNSEKWIENKQEMIKVLTGQVNAYYEIKLKMPLKRLRYAFLIEENKQKVFYGDRGFFNFDKKYYDLVNYYFAMPYAHEIDKISTPSWVLDTVWYQIFPERFCDGDKTNNPKGCLRFGSQSPTRFNFFGGDLRGVIDKLDYLAKLGINGLYFCPIFKAESNHKYDTIDYFEIDPSFGSKEDFKELVKKAHELGMKVMLDAVFNHTGDDFFKWKEVEQGEEKAKSWYHLNAVKPNYIPTDNYEVAYNLNYEVFAHNPHMPKLNTENLETKEYLLEVASYWIENFDIDAWRLDVANEIDHVFWREFKKKCQEIKPDFYIVGEVWHTAMPWLFGDQFSGVMNYAFTETILEYFVQKEIKKDEFVELVSDHLMKYPWPVNFANLNMLDSHDKARILTKANGNLNVVKQMLAFMFIHPGTPGIYYGTEVGMEGGEDPLNRGCMIWNKDKWNVGLFEFMKSLISIYHQYSSIINSTNIKYEVKDSNLKVIRWNSKENLVAIFGVDDEFNGEVLLQADDFVIKKIVN